ncbi:MAG: hypothetical protein WEA61_10900 [Anaerolineales bacterium]
MPSLAVKLDRSGKILPDAVLRKTLSSATRALVRAVVQEAEWQGAPIYLVGGFVRDLMLNQPSLDLDLVLEGSAIRLGRALEKRFGGRLLVHKAFGTAVWWLPRDQDLLRHLGMPARKAAEAVLPAFIDLISARSETYAKPAALPSVQFDGIRADQFRRDFTINTLALRLDGSSAGQLLDPWGGLRDLKAGLLRTLHPRSFSDDPTRILRILRFAGRLGFRVEPETLTQLKRNLAGLNLLSGERIRNELELILLEERRVGILRQLQRLGVLHQIHPTLRFITGTAASLERADFESPPAYWELATVSSADLGLVIWLMHLAPQDVADIARRVRFTAHLQAAARAASRLRQEHRALSRMPVSRLVARLEKEPQLAVYALFLVHERKVLGKSLQQYARAWRHVRTSITGSDLRKRGLPPGPEYKKILERLRAARLDGKVRTAKQEQTLLGQLLHEHN